MADDVEENEGLVVLDERVDNGRHEQEVLRRVAGGSGILIERRYRQQGDSRWRWEHDAGIFLRLGGITALVHELTCTSTASDGSQWVTHG